MLWIKNHQLLTCSLSLVAVFFLSLFLGPSLSCSAVSYTVTYTADYHPDLYVWGQSGTNYTDLGSPILSFQPMYVEYTVNSTYTGFYSSPGANGYGILTKFQGTGYNLSPLLMFYFQDTHISMDLSFMWDRSTQDYGLILKPSQRSTLFESYNGVQSITFTFYDTIPEGCPDPDPCPEIPETPYGDKLDKIYNAIMIGSGTMLVIYFFFAIYSMFFGGLKQ